MTSEPMTWLEVEKIPEPAQKYRRTTSPNAKLAALQPYRLTSRAWAALSKLGWLTPRAVVCGDVEKLRSVVGAGPSTWGEIARLRRHMMEKR